MICIVRYIMQLARAVDVIEEKCIELCYKSLTRSDNPYIFHIYSEKYSADVTFCRYTRLTKFLIYSLHYPTYEKYK